MFIFNQVYMYRGMCGTVTMRAGSLWGQKGLLDSLEPESQGEFWNLNLGPLGEQYEPLTIFPISSPNIFYGVCGSELYLLKPLQLLTLKFQEELSGMISFCI